MEFLKEKSVETLVVTNNRLTEEVCFDLAEKERVEKLKNIYLGRNQNMKVKIKEETLGKLE